MAKKTQASSKPFPRKVMDELRENLLRVQPFFGAVRLWDDVLTENEKQLLGGDIRKAYKPAGTIGIWMRLRRVSQPRAIIELAFELGFLDERKKQRLLRETDELADSIDEAISQAVESKALVLVEPDRAVYWNGDLIEIDWHKHPALWNFLWVLCERAKSGGSVDHTHFAEGVQPEYASKTKFKLRQTDGFPADLADRIVAADRGAQKLDLPAERIRQFSVKTAEILNELIEPARLVIQF